MAKVRVTAKKDFIESIVSARPIAALSEIIWNGFDAQSLAVNVYVDYNKMHGIESVRVQDFGCGIDHSLVEKYFGGLGESWKKSARKQNGRALHGKNGKGRFKAFALGEHVQWNTTYKKDGKTYSYSIVGHLNSIDDFNYSDPVEVSNDIQTGTEVVISNLRHDFKSLRDGAAPIELAKTYAAYLTEYPDLRLEFDGETIDPHTAQVQIADYQLNSATLDNGRTVPVSLTVIEWRVPTDRVLHLCDRNGVTLHTLPLGNQIRAPGFEFTAYIKSELFLDLDRSNSLVLADLHPTVQLIFAGAKSKLRAHFRKRLAENQSEIVAAWKRENIYPYEDKDDLGPVELAERQVFDIVAVNVQSYLPSFENADNKSKKFTFLLLAQALKENPESVQLIISQVLGLRKSDQDQLAELLRKTSFPSIISSAKTVANRLDFLNGLETLVFDKDYKEALLERDQLHKILEKEAWIFHEEFSLAGSEQRLEEVLDKHLAILGNREDDKSPVDIGDGKRGRVDLMLHKAIQPRTGEYDYLIIELKRPSKKIDGEVLSQIEKYAIAVASDPRFNDIPARWTFMAISSDLDNYARRRANQREKPRGMVFDDAELNITVWVKSWSDIINDARSKLNFINEQLSYEADRDSAKSYLHKTHARFIPDLEKKSDNDDKGSEEEDVDPLAVLDKASAAPQS